MQPPLGYSQPMAEKKPSVKEFLSTLIVETRGRFNKDEARLDNMETHYTNISAIMKSLEMRVGQLATELKNQQKG